MVNEINAQHRHMVAIVTGGGRGLGKAMAWGLAEAGYRVVVTGARAQHELEQLRTQALDEFSDDRLVAVQADVTQERDCARVVAAACGHGAHLGILVNNAGRGMKYLSEDFLTRPTRFWESDPDAWRMVIDTNVNGPFLMARAALPEMFKHRWGRIINISMNHATMRREGFSPYGPSKAALESETCIWAQELEGSGITVNALLPGGASDTGMIPESISTEIKTQLLDPRVMVDPLLWLVSEQSDTVTGKRIIANQWRKEAPNEGLEVAGF